MGAGVKSLRGTIMALEEAYSPILLPIFCIVIVWSAAQSAYAGAWNLPKNEGQIIVTGAFTGGNSIFDDDGNRQEADFSKTESRIFFEHGAADRWTLTANTALQMSQFQSEQSVFNFDDFDDTELGLRYQLKRREGFAVSVQASYIIDGGSADNILDIGGGRDVVELRGLWGQSYETQRWGDVFFDAQIAGRLRVSGGQYDSTRADLTLGYKPTPKWFVFLQNFSTLRASETAMGFRVDEQFQFKSNISLGYSYKANRFIQFGYSETLFGRNIVKERGVFISTWVKY